MASRFVDVDQVYDCLWSDAGDAPAPDPGDVERIAECARRLFTS